MLLSIIIPAYNAEKYIVDCLDSCFHWTEALADSELEVIVVDDGSTDATPTLLQQYAQTHTNLHLLHQANQGQSVARNLAISRAQGDYIYMVDADDAMIGSLPIETMQSQKYDIIGLQVMYRPENGVERPWSHQIEHWPFDREYNTGADFVRSHNIEGLVYGYLFRRNLFLRYTELRFTPGIYHQDEELIFKIFTLAGPTIYRKGYVYRYYEHSGSSLNTRTAQRKRKLMDDFLVILRHLVTWRDEHDLAPIMHYKLSFLAMDVIRILIAKRYEPEYALKVIEELKNMNLYPLPWVKSFKYLGMKLLTCRPELVTFWIKLSDKEHQTALQ